VKPKGYPTNGDGCRIVEVIFSEATMRHLERLASFGLYGVGIEGVIEGFVYRGLQALRASERPKDS